MFDEKDRSPPLFDDDEESQQIQEWQSIQCETPNVDFIPDDQEVAVVTFEQPPEHIDEEEPVSSEVQVPISEEQCFEPIHKEHFTGAVRGTGNIVHVLARKTTQAAAVHEQGPVDLTKTEQKPE